jgi:hypothetical protein
VTSKNRDDATGYNRSLIREIEFLGKCLARLTERFEIEKEDSREAGDIDCLEKLRERSRTFFLPEAGSLLNRLLRVRSRTREGEGADEVEKSCVDTEKQIRKAITHFVSTPHRLIRSFDTVQGSQSD